jgi:general secretion pathway protein K
MLTCRRGEHGFVLVSVVWIAGLLAVVATSFVIAVRSYTLAGANAASNARAESIADGMAVLTATRLAAGTPFKLDGEARYCRWSDDVTVAVAVQDQGGLVDLNTASPGLLAALLRGLGAGEAAAAAMQEDLLDFRDADSQTTSGGAEPATYPGKSYGPKNAPLAVGAEIDQVQGIDGDFLRRLMPHVTVYSQQPGLDPAVAPQALRTLLGMAGNAGEQPHRFASPSPAKVFAIDAVAELDNGARYRRLTVVSLLRQPERPFAILEWRRAGDPEGSRPLPRTGDACVN